MKFKTGDLVIRNDYIRGSQDIPNKSYRAQGYHLGVVINVKPNNITVQYGDNIYENQDPRSYNLAHYPQKRTKEQIKKSKERTQSFKDWLENKIHITYDEYKSYSTNYKKDIRKEYELQQNETEEERYEREEQEFELKNNSYDYDDFNYRRKKISNLKPKRKSIKKLIKNPKPKHVLLKKTRKKIKTFI